MNPDTFDQQAKDLFDAAQTGNGALLREHLLAFDLNSSNEAANRLKEAETQLRLGDFFTVKRAALDDVYAARPSSSDTDKFEAYADRITAYLTDFDADLENFEEVLNGTLTAEKLAVNAEDASVQQLIVQTLTQKKRHDQTWFVSRAHMTRDGVNESLWSIVTASEEDTDMFIPVLDGAFRAANDELAMATNALVPQRNTVGEES